MYTKSEQVTGEVEIWAIPRQAWQDPTDPPFRYQIGRSYIHTGEVKVSTHEVTLTMPAGVNLYLAAMETLETAKADAFKVYQNKAEEIDKQIKAMLQLAGPGTYGHGDEPAAYEPHDLDGTVLSSEVVGTLDPYNHTDLEPGDDEPGGIF
jgi:hypothetical protein